MILSYFVIATLAGGLLSLFVAASLTVATTRVPCDGLVGVPAGLPMGTAHEAAVHR